MIILSLLIKLLTTGRKTNHYERRTYISRKYLKKYQNTLQSIFQIIKSLSSRFIHLYIYIYYVNCFLYLVIYLARHYQFKLQIIWKITDGNYLLRGYSLS